jgi:exodeoxyribonuclease VII small subunit
MNKDEKAKPEAKDGVIPFEKALERLEKIVAEMESGELGLDALITRFEEGSALVKQCGAQLDEVEKKIEKLIEKDGQPALAPLDPDTED